MSQLASAAVTAPQWCSYEAAVAWLRRAYGFAEGAALNAADEALASGNVQRRARRTHPLLQRQFGKDFGLIPSRPDYLGDMFVDDIELHFADFCSQMHRQIGSTRRRATTREAKPSQEEVNEMLRKHAEAGGKRLKQDDKEVRKILTTMGSTWRQTRKAFVELPKELKYTKGRPGRSNT